MLSSCAQFCVCFLDLHTGKDKGDNCIQSKRNHQIHDLQHRDAGFGLDSQRTIEIACGQQPVMAVPRPPPSFTPREVQEYIVAAFQQEMLRLSQQLPEFDTVMEMYGVGPSLGPQLMAEIGDVRRFSSKKLLIAFAGIEPQPNDSGKIVGNDSGISKVGSAVLRRTLFLIMTVILKTQPQDEPVFQFMNKKRSEGKPYKVYMMASANKFLRIYYARVKAVMDSKHSK